MAQSRSYGVISQEGQATGKELLQEIRDNLRKKQIERLTQYFNSQLMLGRYGVEVISTRDDRGKLKLQLETRTFLHNTAGKPKNYGLMA